MAVLLRSGHFLAALLASSKVLVHLPEFSYFSLSFCEFCTQNSSTIFTCDIPLRDVTFVIEGEEKDRTEEEGITQPLTLSSMSPFPVSHVSPWSTPMVNMDMMDMDNDNEDNDNDDNDNDKEDNG